MKLGLLGAHILPFLIILPPAACSLVLPQFGYSSPGAWGHSLGRKIRIKTKAEVCSPHLAGHSTPCSGEREIPLVQVCSGFSPSPWRFGGASAQLQPPGGLTPSCIRCHLTSPLPLARSSTCLDVSLMCPASSGTRQPLRRCLHRKVPQAGWCRGCYTLLSRCLL